VITCTRQQGGLANPIRRGFAAPPRPVASGVRAVSVGVSVTASRRASTALLVAALLMACPPVAAAQTSLADDPLFGDSDSEISAPPSGFPDPFEEINRGTLGFNRTLDRWLLDPVTRAYRDLLPPPVKTSLRSAFRNIAAVPALVNQVLQGEVTETCVTAGRFAVNTTIGLLGLLDPATELGLEERHADFGQTLAKLGVGSGPYLIIPVLGPTTVRDGLGGIVDIFIHPTTFFLGPFQRLFYSGSSGLSLRESNYEALKALDESSIDYYAALRNGYYQARTADIWNGEPPPPPRKRVCDSMAPRLKRQPWRRSRHCPAASPPADSLAAWSSKD
jgi:phospholipid-binding lipoprotein MlaA